MAELANRRALVTGGASGLGKAISRAFADAGAQVVVADVAAASAAAVAAEIGGQSWTVNLADTSALDGADLDVDILVNNAGSQRIHPITEFPIADWQLITTLRLAAPFVLATAHLPKRGERGRGRIINLSSIHALRASTNQSPYGTTKPGLTRLT